MSNNNSNAPSCTIGFPGLLFIVFIVLKLCGVINWSWWWVTAPIWGSLAIGVLVFAVGIILAKIVMKHIN